MIRKHKIYSKPRRAYEAARIKDENETVKKYGLKSKREIWKAEAKIGEIRGRAKALITADEEKKQAFFEKLGKMGLKVESIADVLALTKEDWLKRRLQTVVFKKGIANTPMQARHLIAHKHIRIAGNAVNIPSYVVNVDEEESIKSDIVIKKKGEKKEKKVERGEAEEPGEEMTEEEGTESEEVTGEENNE